MNWCGKINGRSSGVLWVRLFLGFISLLVLDSKCGLQGCWGVVYADQVVLNDAIGERRGVDDGVKTQLEILAEQGDMWAQYIVALIGYSALNDGREQLDLYEFNHFPKEAKASIHAFRQLPVGWDPKLNAEQVLSYFRQAALGGVADAWVNLSRCCRLGFGVTQADDEVAMQLFHKGLERGSFLAEYDRFFILYEELRDAGEHGKLFHLSLQILNAARNGHVESMTLVAELYFLNGIWAIRNMASGELDREMAGYLHQSLMLGHHVGFGLLRQCLSKTYLHGPKLALFVPSLEYGISIGHGGCMHMMGLLYAYGWGGKPVSREMSAHWFLQAAEAGDVQGASDIGARYLNGDGVAQNIEQAKYWLEVAVGLDSPRAKHILGMAHINGVFDVVGDQASDPELGICLLEEAGDDGHVLSYLQAGYVLGGYLEGVVVEQDAERAVEYFRYAAEAGDLLAQINLVMALNDLRRQEQLFVKKHTMSKEIRHWLLMAAKSGQPEAMCLLGKLYLVGEEGYSGIVLIDVAQGEVWLKRAAEVGQVDAMEQLGHSYLLGYGLAHNHTEGVRYLKQAADLGSVFAMWNLASYLLHQEDQSLVREGVVWMQMAADRGYAKAINDVGAWYQHGTFVKQDLNRAIQLYQLAIEGGDRTAMANLAFLKINGQGIDQDIAGAVELLEKSAALGDEFGLWQLAELYQKGLGVERDLKRARELFELARKESQFQARGRELHKPQ